MGQGNSKGGQDIPLPLLGRDYGEGAGDFVARCTLLWGPRTWSSLLGGLATWGAVFRIQELGLPRIWGLGQTQHATTYIEILALRTTGQGSRICGTPSS